MLVQSTPIWFFQRRVIRLFMLISAAVLLATGCAQLTQKERELVFRIEPGTPSWFSGMPADVQEIHIPVSSTATTDGKRQQLHAWWWPAANTGAPTVLYLHGARWNLTGQLFRIEQLRSFGFSVLAIDYRGFGKSDGELPSEETVYEDAYTAWKHLASLQPDPARRFIYGHSLGGAVAIDLAARLSDAAERDGTPLPAQGLIVESSFTTLADIARALTSSLLPVQLFLTQKFDSIGKIGSVRMPVLVVHGSGDRYVPAHFSQALYAAAKGPKKLLLIEGATHNNSMRMGSTEYRQALNELFGLDQRFGIVQR